MAQSQVTVVFGAQVAGLIAGVKEAEEAIKSLRAPIDEFIGGLKGIGEASGIAFAIDKIKEWAVEAAEAAEASINMGAALGMSGEQFQNLAGALSIVGENADKLVRNFAMLGRSVDAAIKDPSSAKAFAFRDLQIDAEKFRDTLNGAGGVHEAIVTLAEAYQKLQSSGGNVSVSGPLGALLGPRGFAEFIKGIKGGAEGIAELEARWASINPLQQKGIEELDQLAEKFNLLTGAFNEFTKAITYSLSGPLGAFSDWLTKILADVTKLAQLGQERLPWQGGTQPGASATLPPPGTASGYNSLEEMHATAEELRKLADIAQHESGSRPGRGLHYPAPGQSEDVETLADVFAAHVTKNSHAFGKYGFQPGTYQEAGAITGRTDLSLQSQDVNALATLRQKGMTPWPEMASSGAEGGAGAAAGKSSKQAFDDAHTAYKEYIKEVQEGGKREAAEVEQQIAQAKARGASLEEERKLYGDLDAAKQRMFAAEDEATKNFQAQWGEAGKKVTETYKQHAAERIQADTAFIQQDQRLNQQQVEAAVEVMNAKIKNNQQQEAEEIKQTDRLVQLHQLSARDAQQKDLEIVESHRKAVDAILQQEMALAQAIPALRNRINAQIEANDLAASQRQKSINDKYEDDRLKKAEDINKTIATDFSSTFIQLVTGKETFTQAFARLGEKLGQTLAEKVMEQLLNSSIFGSGGFGGLLSSFLGGIPIIGSLFGGAGGSALGGGLTSSLFGAAPLLEHGGIIPSAAGGWAIPSFASGGILSMLHQGEMVLPKNISEGMQGMIAGGAGGANNFHIHAIDTQSGAQFLMQHGPAIANSWRSAGQYGNLSPRAISSGGRYP